MNVIFWCFVLQVRERLEALIICSIVWYNDSRQLITLKPRGTGCCPQGSNITCVNTLVWTFLLVNILDLLDEVEQNVVLSLASRSIIINYYYYLPNSFSHWVCFLINICGKLPFSHKSHCKKEKSVVSFAQKQNVICSQTQLDEIAHEQAITCGQLFAGHLVGCRPMKRKKKLHQMITALLNIR